MSGEEKESFALYKTETYRVISDLYGRGTKAQQIMKDKIDKCTNTAQITNVLAWGRMNLLGKEWFKNAKRDRK